MESSEASSKLLKNKYELHKTPGVSAAALGQERRTGEKVPQDPLARIDNYLSWWHQRLTPDLQEEGQQDHPGQAKGERNLERVKQVLHNRYIVKPDEIPEGYFENQKRIAREQGHGDIEITPQARGQLTEVIIADQTSSLDKWIDYLASPDAPYPDALKYFTMRSVLNMAEYDKERKMYPQRSKGTTKPFPDLNREALAYVLDVVDKKYKGQSPDQSAMDELSAQEFTKLLAGENFAKLYAWAIEKVTPATEEELSAINGEWVKYDQNSDPTSLVVSLQGHGTGWCTAGESTARIQLQKGDFYVYYSKDIDGKPKIPRAAIRMAGGRIAEVRGIAAEQNLDGGAVAVVEDKLKEFPDGLSYQKKVADMQRLTIIENAVNEGQNLSGDDLAFLYEIDSSIDGFGHDKDPRIEEIRSQRNPEEDMPVVFGCEPSQIAHSVSQIRPDMKAYVGPLEKGIFDKLQNIEHIYASFPEGKIHRETLEIGGKSAQQLEQEMEQAGIHIYVYAKDMLHSPYFTTLPTPQNIDTVRLNVGSLGFGRTATTEQIYAKAKELGLEPCPIEVGPHKRLKDTNQPIGGGEYIAMKQIADRRHHGRPGMFFLVRGEDGLWLSHAWVYLDYLWHPRREFVFSLRPSTHSTSA